MYFEFPLNSKNFALLTNHNFSVRIANKDDISKFETDIYPFLINFGGKDKDYISRIGQKNDYKFFVIEHEGKLIHYNSVFNNSLESPLMATPINKNNVIYNDAYLGSVFTCPNARGKGLAKYSISKILEYLINQTNASRALICISVSGFPASSWP